VNVRFPGYIVIAAFLLLLASLVTLLGLISILRLDSLWALLLAPIALLVLAIFVGVVVRLLHRANII
jgi:hypothetical protein